MRSELVSLERSPEAIVAELRELIPAGASVAGTVGEIIQAVRSGGDGAVADFTRRFDTGGADPKPLEVGSDELEAAAHGLTAAVRDGLALAIRNVRRVAEAGLREQRTVTFEHHEVVIRTAPVATAAVYVPGGRAPYPSTVVMGVVTARVAGVEHVVVCAPPGSNGDIDPVVLGACRLTGAAAVHRMGGAQAIAALAYGTETITPVDVIVGPGNLYVQEAKRQVSGQVGIDGFAGPSDLLVIADDGVPAEPIALDLLAQAEHGPGTLVIAASTSPEFLDAVRTHLDSAPETGAVCRLVELPGMPAGLALAEAFAPEHLQLVGPRAEAMAPAITRAGCVFVGIGGATAFGDYIAGSNHVLPTGGAARFASSLSTAHFRRGFTEVRINDGSRLARAAAPVARAEGFEFHARSMEARIRENASDDA